jgi:squalene-hopene/tetraprenyl-beta-curcumene cyclase
VPTSFRTNGRWLLTSTVLLLSLTCLVRGAGTAAGPSPQEIQAVRDKALAFLKTRQNEDGSFSPQLGGPGITALIVAGCLRNGVSPDDPLVAKALGYLEKKVHKDGGIYDKGLANYTTSVALLAFREANTNGRYDTVIKQAAAFLKTLQYDEALVEDKDPKFGGVGYDKNDKRPDLSNTQYFLEALLAAGVPKTDPAVQRALKFVNRCQNWPGEFNDQPFAQKATDDDKGGLTYNPLNPEKNPNRTPQGGLRSSGVMTYAGLKSFLHAGVSKEDPRVKAAVGWIRRHYALDANPGQGQSGLYYYYHTFGKAMHALSDDTFTDATGKQHDWRKDLFEALKKRQKANGSWSNEDKAFFENNPDLATAYALLSLSYCRPAKERP